MTNLIQVEFHRWSVIKKGELNGIQYRISKFAPKGVFKEYTAGVLVLGEYLPFSALNIDSGGFKSVEEAESVVRYYIERYMKRSAMYIGMDY